MEIEDVRDRLRRYQRKTVAGAEFQRAAVALILRTGSQGTEFLAIHRSERQGDPWSGHMAFPGGRQHPCDLDLFITAARETLEEVGIDLTQVAEPLGRLDDLQAVGGGRRLDLVITPFVCALTGPVTPIPDPREVQSALWVPLATLGQTEAASIHLHEIGGLTSQHEAFVYRGHTIWGLTYRILQQFLEVLK